MIDYPRFDPLIGRRGIWLRQHSDTGERTKEAIAATIRDLLGGNLLVQKVMDGTTWQGLIDPETPLRSLEDVRALRDFYASYGIAWCPVVVPRSPDIASPTTQAREHGAIARLCGCLMTDIEPYAGFFQTQFHRIPDYCAALRQHAGDAFLINQPDPREWAVTDARVEETARYFDGVAAQHYVGWTAGGVNWTDIEQELRRLRTLRAWFPNVYVTLYGVDRVDLAAAFWHRSRTEGAKGFHVFALGPMDAEQLRYFSHQMVPFAPEPIPGTEEPEPPQPKPEPEPTPTPDARTLAAEMLQRSIDDEIRAVVRREHDQEVLNAL